MAILLLTLLFFAMVMGVWVGMQFFQSSTAVFGGSPLGNAAALVAPATLQKDKHGRTNVLITGNSVDNPGHPGAKLTDSVMVLSIDTSESTAFLLSVPRDLLVNVPGYGYQKINATYPLGEADGPGGMKLLSTVISDNLGLPVHYHMLVNYAAVRETVNAVGGVEVTIRSVDERGLYDPNISTVDGGPLRLKNGPQHLDGQTALNFARARGEPAPDGRVGYGFPRSDFNRTEHQRQLLAALKDKILEPEVLFNPFTLGRIFEAASGNVQTDLEINEAYRLVSSLRSVPELRPVSLSTDEKPLLTGYSTYALGSALIPAAGLDDL
jgi:polyisoprenyl-teichoic acid--peptidoglycan teichoic acid transferase